MHRRAGHTVSLISWSASSAVEIRRSPPTFIDVFHTGLLTSSRQHKLSKRINAGVVFVEAFCVSSAPPSFSAYRRAAFIPAINDRNASAISWADPLVSENSHAAHITINVMNEVDVFSRECSAAFTSNNSFPSDIPCMAD